MRVRWIMKTTIESSGRMHGPAHPGEILKEMYMTPLGVTVTKVADALGVTRKHVSAIVNGRVPVTPDMAVRLAGVFGTEPEIWVNLQAQYDLWLVRQQARPKVKQLHVAA
jgi:antitoxin HigA-1